LSLFVATFVIIFCCPFLLSFRRNLLLLFWFSIPQESAVAVAVAFAFAFAVLVFHPAGIRSCYCSFFAVIPQRSGGISVFALVVARSYESHAHISHLR